jgi:hypothetical protein
MRFIEPKIPYLTEDIVGTDEGCGIFIPANRMLYSFVRENPSNLDRAMIASKALVIGRSLSASPERRTSSVENPVAGTSNFYAALADSIATSLVDELLEMCERDEHICPQLSTHAVKTHRFLCDAVSKVMGKDCSSFASKYLHFHRPNIFPMMDSRARVALGWIAEEQDWRFAVTTSRDSKNYRAYVDFYLKVREFLQEKWGSPLSLRQMDNILLNRYDLNI